MNTLLYTMCNKIYRGSRFYLFSLTLLLCLGTIQNSFAQKHTLPYQTIITDNHGDALKDIEVEILVELRGFSAAGSLLYSETHNNTTDLSGAIAFNIGTGNPQSIEFIELDWSIPIYVTVKFRPPGFINYFDNNSTELLAVPYAAFSLYSTCLQGCPGADGIDGADGLPGEQGYLGPQSPNASQGPQGPQGQTGIPGVFEFTLRSTEPFSSVDNEVYLDDGTNRADSKPGLRIYLNNTWQDL